MFSFEDFNTMFRNSVSRRGEFSKNYNSFSVSMLPGNDRQDVERGGKIIMPQSALETLTQSNVEYPMLFKLINHSKSRTSHAGVLEFVADEGNCYLPNWMMKNLSLEESDSITVEFISLPVATFSKFQALSTEFLDITNPKAVLENALRNFACLTTGDIIAIKYNKKIYELSVLETKPGNAVSIIECDMNVEFEAPVGYEEPTTTKSATAAPLANNNKNEDFENEIHPFDGVGMRLDGKPKKSVQIEETIPIVKKKLPRGIPDYNYVLGNLEFDRTVKPISDKQENEQEAVTKNTDDNIADNTTNNRNDDDEQDLWGGQGFSMRKN